MRYNDIRNHIRPGDVIACSHEGWGSWSDIESQIVRIATRSEYTHVGIAWPIAGRVMIIEAVVPEIRIFPLAKLLPFYWISLGGEFTAKAEEFALSRVGEEYSKWEAIKGYFGGTDLNNGHWQCAEFVQAVLRVNGTLPRGRTKATPTDLVRCFLESGSSLVMVK